MQYCEITHKGLVRTTNQDTLIIDKNIYGVADGMGGHKGGKTASDLASSLIKKALLDKTPCEKTLQTAISLVNNRIHQTSIGDEELTGMGTTLCFLWEAKNEILVANVGDSRAYLLRNEQFSQITQDHSVVAELLRKNVISKETAKIHPYRNVLTKAIGIDCIINADIFHYDKQIGDRWLICSDGLFSMLDDEVIKQVISTNTLENSCDILLEKTLEAGATDNVTIVLTEVVEDNNL